MNHVEIEQMLLFPNVETGEIVRLDRADAAATPVANIVVVMGPRLAPHPDFVTLLTAAPVLYQQLTDQQNGLQRVIEEIEKYFVNGELIALTEALRQMQNGCMLAQQVAQSGMQKVADLLNKESKPT